MLEPEEVRTRRLVLRRMQPHDAEDFVALSTAVETHPYDAHLLPSPDQAREAFDRFRRSWDTDGISYWAIRRPESDGVIGFGGVRQWLEGDEPVLNLYYRLWPTAWGRGYATEMARAALQWSRRHRPDRPILIITDADNAPSVRIARKLGFTLHEERSNGTAPELLFRLPGPTPSV